MDLQRFVLITLTFLGYFQEQILQILEIRFPSSQTLCVSSKMYHDLCKNIQRQAKEKSLELGAMQNTVVTGQRFKQIHNEYLDGASKNITEQKSR